MGRVVALSLFAMGVEFRNAREELWRWRNLVGNCHISYFCEPCLALSLSVPGCLSLCWIDF